MSYPISAASRGLVATKRKPAGGDFSAMKKQRGDNSPWSSPSSPFRFSHEQAGNTGLVEMDSIIPPSYSIPLYNGAATSQMLEGARIPSTPKATEGAPKPSPFDATEESPPEVPLVSPESQVEPTEIASDQMGPLSLDEYHGLSYDDEYSVGQYSRALGATSLAFDETFEQLNEMLPPWTVIFKEDSDKVNFKDHSRSISSSSVGSSGRDEEASFRNHENHVEANGAEMISVGDFNGHEDTSPLANPEGGPGADGKESTLANGEDEEAPLDEPEENSEANDSLSDDDEEEAAAASDTDPEENPNPNGNEGVPAIWPVQVQPVAPQPPRFSPSKDDRIVIPGASLTPEDIIGGRSSRGMHHSGTLAFEREIGEQWHLYQSFGRRHKAKSELTESILARERNGRFIKKLTNGEFVLMTREEARTKVSQQFREETARRKKAQTN